MTFTNLNVNIRLDQVAFANSEVNISKDQWHFLLHAEEKSQNSLQICGVVFLYHKLLLYRMAVGRPSCDWWQQHFSLVQWKSIVLGMVYKGVVSGAEHLAVYWNARTPSEQALFGEICLFLQKQGHLHLLLRSMCC